MVEKIFLIEKLIDNSKIQCMVVIHIDSDKIS